MTSFVVSTDVSAQYSLQAEAGLVTANGTLHSGSTPALVVMEGNASLTVLGAIIGNTPTFSPNGTVNLVAAGNEVLIGANGILRNPAGDALFIGTAGSFSRIVNQGTIIGQSNAIDNNSTSVSSVLRMTNSGTIIGQSESAIESTSSLVLTNTGTISTFSGVSAAIFLGGGDLVLTNLGTVSGGAYAAISGNTAARFTIRNEGLIQNDVLMGSGADIFRGGEGQVIGRVVGQGGSDVIITGRGDDTITGDAGLDTLAAGSGDDSLLGGEGDDILRSGSGADTCIGGSGDDLMDYRASQGGIEVDLITGYTAGGDATGDVLSQIENLRGSGFADTLSGSNQDNVLTGGSGNDLLEGRGGRDLLVGDSGADTLNGGDGVLDRVSYAQSHTNVIVNLATNFVTGGFANGDVIQGIEGVEGTAFGDGLTGSADANQILGGGGADVITGGRGNDTLTGGLGPEGDTFVFTSGDGIDLITDAEIGRDVIDLTAYGFSDFGQVIALCDLSNDGQDILIIFGRSPLSLSGVITLKGLGGLDFGDLDQSIQIFPPE
jgi:Ca2+-binding RTX toxin-like protein